MSLLRLSLAAFLALSAPLAAPLQAETADADVTADAGIPALAKAMQLDDLFAVLRDEGVNYGETLETDMFPGGGGPRWRDDVDAIYNVPQLRAAFDAVLVEELGKDPVILGQILDFYGTDLGQRVAGLEVAARRAFLDTAQEEAARVAAEERTQGRDPKVPLVDQFIAAGDLIEMNVAGGLSGNLAFLKGLSETGGNGQPVPEDELLQQVWEQEDQIRADSTSWLHAYLGLAYDPLTESELSTYVAFMESPAGQRLNAALFTAFDRVFRQVSYDLGRAAGRAMLGRDI